MRYIFPRGLYVDVRIEHTFTTEILYTLKDLDECKTKKDSAAFIRLYDGNLWYYASTCNLNEIQREIDYLATIATSNPNMKLLPIYVKFSGKVDEKLIFTKQKVSEIPLQSKIGLLNKLMPFVEEHPYMKLWRLAYLMSTQRKSFIIVKALI